jgi:hypothetical protein
MFGLKSFKNFISQYNLSKESSKYRIFDVKYFNRL